MPLDLGCTGDGLLGSRARLAAYMPIVKVKDQHHAYCSFCSSTHRSHEPKQQYAVLTSALNVPKITSFDYESCSVSKRQRVHSSLFILFTSNTTPTVLNGK